MFLVMRSSWVGTICLQLFSLDRDHAGGNDKIREMVPGIKVFGGSSDNVKGCTNKLENGDRLSLGEDVEILALHTPWYAATPHIFSMMCLSAPFLNISCHIGWQFSVARIAHQPVLDKLLKYAFHDWNYFKNDFK